jgi:hypothetical protein
VFVAWAVLFLAAAGAEAPPPPPPPPLSTYAAPEPLPAPPPLSGAEADPPRAATASEARTELEVQESDRPLLGLLADASVPGGLGASAVFRPWRFLRVHAGGLTNTVSSGARGGLSLVPIHFPIAPSATFEVGWLSAGDVAGLIKSAVGTRVPGDLYTRLGYWFESVQLGLELGSPDRFVVWIRAGFSWVQASLTGASQALPGGSGARIDPGELKVRVTIPSGGLGLLLYFG